MTIVLPEVSGANQSSLNKFNNILELSSVDMFSLNAENINDEEFSPIIPTGYTSGALNKPINCYMVLASGPDKDFNLNYCGKRSATTNLIESTYVFGQYVGLRPSGSALEMELSPGLNRKIIVLGAHSIDADSCKDLSLKPEKQNFSKLHVLGTSDNLKLEPAGNITVTIPLAAPTATNQIDDCVFSTDANSLLQATAITIENKSFPSKVFKKYPSVGNRCEPLDVVLKNTSDFDKSAAATSNINAQIYNTVAGTPVIRPIYENYLDCSGDISSSTSFSIFANSPSKRVWTRTSFSDPSSSDFTVATSAGLQQIVTNFTITQNITTEYAYDVFMPKQVNPGICYPISVSYRNLDGSFSSASASSMDISLSALDVNNNNAANFYYNDPTCATAAQSVFSIASSQFTPANVIYMKLPTSLSTEIKYLNLTVNKNAGPQTVYSYKSKVKISRDIASTPKLANVRAVYKDYFPKNVCLPLKLQFLDQKGNLVNAVAGDYIEVSLAESSYNQVSIHDSDAACTGGSDIASYVPANKFNLSASSSQHYLYLWTTSGATDLGDKYITLVYNGFLKKKIKFTVISDIH
ncbi:hypothetical protein K2P97_13285 [bacterium]|nr:hypothetical protein [bacterium]